MSSQLLLKDVGFDLSQVVSAIVEPVVESGLQLLEESLANLPPELMDPEMPDFKTFIDLDSEEELLLASEQLTKDQIKFVSGMNTKTNRPYMTIGSKRCRMLSMRKTNSLT